MWRKRSILWPQYEVFDWNICICLIKSLKHEANTTACGHLLTCLICVNGVTLISLSEIVRIYVLLVLCDLEERCLFFDL